MERNYEAKPTALPQLGETAGITVSAGLLICTIGGAATAAGAGAGALAPFVSPGNGLPCCSS